MKAGGKTFTCTCRIDTPVEMEYYRNGGILQTVLRKMLGSWRVCADAVSRQYQRKAWSMLYFSPWSFGYKHAAMDRRKIYKIVAELLPRIGGAAVLLNAVADAMRMRPAGRRSATSEFAGRIWNRCSIRTTLGPDLPGDQRPRIGGRVSGDGAAPAKILGR